MHSHDEDPYCVGAGGEVCPPTQGCRCGQRREVEDSGEDGGEDLGCGEGGAEEGEGEVVGWVVGVVIWGGDGVGGLRDGDGDCFVIRC